MSYSNKYNNTAAEIFQLRMQLKAEVNDLRKTYQQIVLQKPISTRKLYGDKLYVKTTLIPDSTKSPIKTPQKRHYSPNLKTQVSRQESFSCKRQFKNIKNSSSFKQVLKQQLPRKRSLSPALQTRHKSSMHQFPSHNQSFDGLKVSLNDKSIIKQIRPTKKIIPKYHQYKYDLLLG